MKSISRREFDKQVCTLLSGSILPSAVTSPLTGSVVSKTDTRPNIVFISSDNHCFRDMGYTGQSIVRTPNMDRIASEGVVFFNAYCGSPVCTPARACMMTGMFPSDTGSYCNATPWNGGHPTWAFRLKQAGYYCRSIGKLDLHHAFDTGFEEFESKHGHVDNPDITALFRRPLCYRVGERINVNGGPRENRHQDASWTDMAVRFLTQEAPLLEKPWVLNVGLHQPHVAFFERLGFLALDRYYAGYPLDDIPMPVIPSGHLENQHPVFQELRRFKRLEAPIAEERIRRARAGYYGMITELDEYVGRIWSALQQSGQLENTLFIFTSDNGMSMGEHGLFYHNSLYEESVHVPLFIAGAGIQKHSVIHTPVSHMDVAAAVLETAGIQKPAELRGNSLFPLVNGKAETHNRFVYSENHSEGNCTGSFMIRKGPWKYIHCTWYDDLLFNLEDDPGEFRNLVQEPDVQLILQELQSLLYTQVQPEEITVNAFQAQEKILQALSDRHTEDELYQLFEFRLGPGQARALAAKCKGR
jgi:choline-sulfatase